MFWGGSRQKQNKRDGKKGNTIALSNKVKEEEHLRDVRRLRRYLHGPMDYAKTPKP